MTATFSFFFFLKVMPLPHIIPRRGWKSCNALANHSNGVGGVHSKKTILLPRGSIPCNNGSNNLTQLSTPFKPKFKISSGSASTDLDTKKDSKLWKKVLKVIYYFNFTSVGHSITTWTILLNNTYEVRWTFDYPPPPLLVHMVI